MRHTIMLFLTLVAFWLVNSGHYTAFIISLGAISIVIVILIAHKMDVVDHEAQPLHLTLKTPTYFIWLAKEIVVTNLTVVKHIWLGNKSISPGFVTITATQKSDMGKVIYANSITLTPGTVTVSMDGDKFLVHALLRELIDDLEKGEMDQRVSALETKC